MDNENLRQTLASSIKALYKGFMSTRYRLFDVVEIPHLVEVDDQDINISKDFCSLEKSLKYMKKKSNRHVFMRASEDARNLIASLKFILRAVMNYKKSVILLDYDLDQDTFKQYLLMEKYFDYQQAQCEEDPKGKNTLTQIGFL